MSATDTLANDIAPVIVTDTGFGPDDGTVFHDLDGGDALPGDLSGLTAIRVRFAAFSDGRGFTLGRQLRLAGFTGRLRAAGPLLADQYAMARRAGFDEVEIPADIARRQPEDQWRVRADWRSHDHQSRLRG